MSRKSHLSSKKSKRITNSNTSVKIEKATEPSSKEFAEHMQTKVIMNGVKKDREQDARIDDLEKSLGNTARDKAQDLAIREQANKLADIDYTDEQQELEIRELQDNVEQKNFLDATQTGLIKDLRNRVLKIENALKGSCDEYKTRQEEILGGDRVKFLKPLNENIKALKDAGSEVAMLAENIEIVQDNLLKLDGKIEMLIRYIDNKF